MRIGGKRTAQEWADWTNCNMVLNDTGYRWECVLYSQDGRRMAEVSDLVAVQDVKGGSGDILARSYCADGLCMLGWPDSQPTAVIQHSPSDWVKWLGEPITVDITAKGQVYYCVRPGQNETDLTKLVKEA